MGNFTTSRRVYFTLVGLLCSIAVLLVIPAIALASPAHAEYVSSDPAANAMLTKAPTTITVHFSEERSTNPEEDVTRLSRNYLGPAQNAYKKSQSCKALQRLAQSTPYRI